MYLAQIHNPFIENIHQIAFLLSLIITIAFYKEYKSYTAKMQKEDLLDTFLNDQ